MSSAFAATFGARRKYLSMSLGFADPSALTQETIGGAQGTSLFRYRRRDELFNDTPSEAANSAAAFFTDVGSFNG